MLEQGRDTLLKNSQTTICRAYRRKTCSSLYRRLRPDVALMKKQAVALDTAGTRSTLERILAVCATYKAHCGYAILDHRRRENQDLVELVAKQVCALQVSACLLTPSLLGVVDFC